MSMEMLTLQKGEPARRHDWIEVEDALVHDDVDDDDIEGLLQKLRAANPRVLRIKAPTLTDEQLAMAIMDSDWSNLEALDLFGCYEVGDYAIAALTRKPPPNLRRLGLSWTAVSENGLMLIAKSLSPQLEVFEAVHLQRGTERALHVLNRAGPANIHVTVPAA